MKSKPKTDPQSFATAWLSAESRWMPPGEKSDLNMTELGKASSWQVLNAKKADQARSNKDRKEGR